MLREPPGGPVRGTSDPRGSATAQRRQHDQEAHHADHADHAEDPADELQVDTGQVDVDGERQDEPQRNEKAPVPMPRLILFVRRPFVMTAQTDTTNA